MAGQLTLRWILAVTALAELFVMEIMDLAGLPDGLWKYAFDSALLVALSAPLLYLRMGRGIAAHGERPDPEPPREPIATLEEMQRQAIIRALRVAHGDCRHAALLLGIGRATIYRKLKKYDLSEVANIPRDS